MLNLGLSLANKSRQPPGSVGEAMAKGMLKTAATKRNFTTVPTIFLPEQVCGDATIAARDMVKLNQYRPLDDFQVHKLQLFPRRWSLSTCN